MSIVVEVVTVTIDKAHYLSTFLQLQQYVTTGHSNQTLLSMYVQCCGNSKFITTVAKAHCLPCHDGTIS